MNEQQKEGNSKFSCPALFKKYPYASVAGIIIIVFIIAISLGFAFGLNHHERGDWRERGGNMQWNWQQQGRMWGDWMNSERGNWQGKNSQNQQLPQQTTQQPNNQPTGQVNVQTQTPPQMPVSASGQTTVSVGTGAKK